MLLENTCSSTKFWALFEPCLQYQNTLFQATVNIMVNYVQMNVHKCHLIISGFYEIHNDYFSNHLHFQGAFPSQMSKQFLLHCQ